MYKVEKIQWLILAVGFSEKASSKKRKKSVFYDRTVFKTASGFTDVAQCYMVEGKKQSNLLLPPWLMSEQRGEKYRRKL